MLQNKPVDRTEAVKNEMGIHLRSKSLNLQFCCLLPQFGLLFIALQLLNVQVILQSLAL
jgi:hypothetical protein